MSIGTTDYNYSLFLSFWLFIILAIPAPTPELKCFLWEMVSDIPSEWLVWWLVAHQGQNVNGLLNVVGQSHIWVIMVLEKATLFSGVTLVGDGQPCARESSQSAPAKSWAGTSGNCLGKHLSDQFSHRDVCLSLLFGYKVNNIGKKKIVELAHLIKTC